MPFDVAHLGRLTPSRRWSSAVLSVGAVAALCVLAGAPPAAGQASVQRVEVTLTFDDVAPHAIVTERLLATAQNVADRLLIGRALDGLLPIQTRLGETLGEVVGRVAAGYVVRSVMIEVGVTSTVSIRLRTVGTVIREVAVSADLRAIHPKLHLLVRDLLQRGTTQEVGALYEGVPILALAWAQPALDARARAAVEAATVGYTATVQVTPGTSARVDLVLVPRDSRVIRNLSVRFRSTSIPILLLDQHAPQVGSMAEPLRGVPVTFAQAHQRNLEQLLEAELAAYPPATEYQVVASVALDVAETTFVIVVADSLTFRGRLEAQLNIGTRAPGPAIVVHLGYLVIPRTEAFVETNIVPNTLGVDWQLGGQVEVAPTTVIGIGYTVVARTVSAFTRFQAGRDVGLRGVWNLTDQSFEGGLNYRLNEFLAGELVVNSRGEAWLRLISNL